MISRYLDNTMISRYLDKISRYLDKSEVTLPHSWLKVEFRIKSIDFEARQP